MLGRVERPPVLVRSKSAPSLSSPSDTLPDLPESTGLGRSKSAPSVSSPSDTLPDLPESIGQLSDLQSLDSGNNQLATLPRSESTDSVKRSFINIEKNDINNEKKFNIFNKLTPEQYIIKKKDKTSINATDVSFLNLFTKRSQE